MCKAPADLRRKEGSSWPHPSSPAPPAQQLHSKAIDGFSCFYKLLLAPATPLRSQLNPSRERNQCDSLPSCHPYPHAHAPSRAYFAVDRAHLSPNHHRFPRHCKNGESQSCSPSNLRPSSKYLHKGILACLGHLGA